jgi:mannose-6-phosphate isomerase-like protein (cupin superfamily)
MTKQYKYTVKEADKFNKHGIDLTLYGQDEPSANVCHVSVREGHFEEFYNVKSAFTYYIVKGKGIFFLDDEPIEVAATDLVVIPPKTRIHYFGTMEMVLTVSPAWEEKDEHHVRFIEKSESPYCK